MTMERYRLNMDTSGKNDKDFKWLEAFETWDQRFDGHPSWKLTWNDTTKMWTAIVTSAFWKFAPNQGKSRFN